MQTTDARTRLRMLGQLDLSAWVEAACGTQLWSVQRRIGAAASKRRARVAVPSCTASGKTYLAARLALAFYDAYTPGTPCRDCDPHGTGSGCQGAKVITLASKFEHLRDVLWGDIRSAYADLLAKGLAPVGRMSQGQNLRLESSAGHFMIGASPNQPESLQGHHGPHILIIGDEATALAEEVTKGLGSTLATGDARLILIFNPTTPDTWAATVSRAPQTETIKITAWDTPHFTGEKPAPAGLLTPEYLEELRGRGEGEGTFTWVTKVCADFWDLGDAILIPELMYDRAFGVEHLPGVKALGIDLAPYGSDMNAIAYRNGNGLVKMSVYPSMRPDRFWEGPVMEAVRNFGPDYLIWDADGVGSGSYGDAERVASQWNNKYKGNLVLLPFRGGGRFSKDFSNVRSAWWWSLRQRFENDSLAIVMPGDDRLRKELTSMTYSVRDTGDIRVETKSEMRKRNLHSPNMADATMYCFSMLDELPTPTKVQETKGTDILGIRDNSVEAMWARDLERLRRPKNERRTPWDRSPDGGCWDDL